MKPEHIEEVIKGARESNPELLKDIQAEFDRTRRDMEIIATFIDRNKIAARNLLMRYTGELILDRKLAKLGVEIILPPGGVSIFQVALDLLGVPAETSNKECRDDGFCRDCFFGVFYDMAISSEGTEFIEEFMASILEDRFESLMDKHGG